MLISKKHKFLFIHIPKTGGTSLVSALKKHSDRAPLPLRAIGYFFDDRGIKLPEWTYGITGYPYHVRAKQVQKKLGKQEYSKLFSFAFVRNPWDITVSEYEYICQKKSHHLHSIAVQLGNFSNYLNWKVKNYNRQQSEWLLDDSGCLIVDKVYKFESYELHANEAIARIGFDYKVPHKNTTVRKSYQDYYRNKEDIEAVRVMYARDIELFGYEF